MPETIRAFIAFSLPARIVTPIGAVQAKIKTYRFKVAWVRPTNIHLTLKFLGNITQEEIRKTAVILEKCGYTFNPMELKAQGLGVFPGIKRPRVIWTGLAGQTDDLTELHQYLNAQLAAIGFKPENRPFKGHLTMGRIKGRINSVALLEAMATCQPFKTDTFVADRLILFESQLKPTGAEYRELMSIRLTKSLNA